MARSRLLAPLLAAWVALPAGALAADPERPAAPSEGKPPEPPPAPAPPPAAPAEEDRDGWLDVGHAFIEHRVFAPILRLDRFFSDERELDAERARSFLRWRNEVSLTDESSQPSFTTGVRATLRLPGLNKRLRRLRIVIAGETRDAVSTLFPRNEPTEEEGAAVEPTTADEDLSRGDAGLRFFLWDSLLSHADLGGGVLVRLPPGGYGRVRFRWAIPVRRLLLARAAVTGFWRTDVHFGTSAAAEVERPITSRVAARLGGTGMISEESAGVEWSGELAALATFGERLGAQVGVGVKGATEPFPLEGTAVVPPDVERYRIYTRLRRDFYRRWIFLELEPEVAWPWDVPHRRHAVWGVAFRLEVQFHGNEAPPRPPEPPKPPEQREPAGPAPADEPPPAEPSGG